MDAQTSKQYTDWLQGQEYHYFFTGTFRNEFTINGARRALERSFSTYDNKPEFAFFCIEPGGMYGRIHTHGLLRYPQGGIFHSATDIWQSWYKRYGRARVEVPRSQENITGYCVKYATKNLIQDTYVIL